MMFDCAARKMKDNWKRDRNANLIMAEVFNSYSFRTKP